MRPPNGWRVARRAEPTLGTRAPAPSRGAVVRQYLTLGLTHILPHGLDHVLFVLSLFLLSTRWQPLLWQVSAFTVAHSLTLGLGMYGLLGPPPAIVEPLIALSIAGVAVDNLRRSELHRSRVAVVFAFGLLHGLGFAGVLTTLGLPRGQFLTALVSFNVGVECGQLLVIGGAFALVGWYRRHPSYRWRVALPASLAIAGIALYWTVERAVALGWS
jgi:HupE / UreJ protein